LDRIQTRHAVTAATTVTSRSQAYTVFLQKGSGRSGGRDRAADPDRD
jgi:hypothetical protein